MADFKTDKASKVHWSHVRSVTNIDPDPLTPAQRHRVAAALVDRYHAGALDDCPPTLLLAVCDELKRRGQPLSPRVVAQDDFRRRTHRDRKAVQRMVAEGSSEKTETKVIGRHPVAVLA